MQWVVVILWTLRNGLPTVEVRVNSDKDPLDSEIIMWPLVAFQWADVSAQKNTFLTSIWWLVEDWWHRLQSRWHSHKRWKWFPTPIGWKTLLVSYMNHCQNATGASFLWKIRRGKCLQSVCMVFMGWEKLSLTLWESFPKRETCGNCMLKHFAFGTISYACCARKMTSRMRSGSNSFKFREGFSIL